MAHSSLDISQIPQSALRQLCFAFDVDGTLTRKDRTISPATTQAIQAIFQAGGSAGVCTGRAYSVLPSSVLGQFNQAALHVIAGGSQVINQPGETLWSNELPGALVGELIQLTLAHGGNYGFGLGKNLYADPPRHADLRRWFPEAVIQEWTALPNLAELTIPELVIININDAIKTALEPYLDQLTLKVMASQEGKINVDITAKGVTKASGLKEMARLRQIPVQDIITVGDDFNDFEMLATGWGVAMGNAVPELKAQAKLVINHTDEDGLAEFIMAVLEARKRL